MSIDVSQPLAGDIVAANLVVLDEGERKLLDGVTFSLNTTEHVAFTGEGRDTLALALSGLVKPSAGTLSIGGRDISELPEAVLGRRIGYVASDTYLFPRTVYDNLIFGLKHRPLQAVNNDSDRRNWLAEAIRSGNPRTLCAQGVPPPRR